MDIVSSAKISAKRQNQLQNKFPAHRFQFFEHMDHVTEAALAKADVLLTYGEDLTPAVVGKMPRLKWIQVLSAGMDAMPFDILKKRNILVTNARGIHGIQMAEYALGMILSLVRRSFHFYDLQKQRRWDRSVRVDEAYGKTLGIVGYGAIGSEMAKRAKAFGMHVIALKKNVDVHPQYVDELVSIEGKEKLFRQSDFIVVLLPLTPETKYFVGKEALQMMKPSAYLINMARGKVIDEEALLQQVKARKLAGAVLDVFSEEPLPEDHPFWQMENIMITPHMSGRSPQYMQRAMDIFLTNLTSFPDKERMVNVIDLDRKY